MAEDYGAAAAVGAMLLSTGIAAYLATTSRKGRLRITGLQLLLEAAQFGL